MKIAVVGNCQVRTIGAGLRRLIPNADISIAWTGAKSDDDRLAVQEGIETFDVIVTHWLVTGPLSTPDIKKRFSGQLVTIPPITFNGTQPDNLIIPSIVGQMGMNHSAICIASWLLGLSPRRCVKLFNSFIYASLGYFDRFQLEKDRLLSHARKWGIDFGEHFDTWSQPFMFDIIHPRMEPLVSITELISQKITNRKGPRDWVNDVNIDFGHKVWYVYPIYPDIAKRLGVPPEDIVFSHTRSDSRPISLREFVESSYNLYYRSDRDILLRAAKPYADIIGDILDLKRSEVPAEAA